MTNGFVNDFTKLVWKNFEASKFQDKGLFMLYFALQYPELVVYRLPEIMIQQDQVKEF